MRSNLHRPHVTLTLDELERAMVRRHRKQQLSRVWSALWPLLSIIFGVLVMAWGIS